MRIRRAVDADLKKVVNIYNQAILKTVATFDIMPKTVEEKKDWIEKQSDQHPFFVAEIGNEVVGWISLSKLFDKQAYHQTAEISLYIDESHRNKGIGNALMDHLMQYVKSKQCIHTIVAKIAEDNDISIKLHEKYGFVLAGILKEVGYKFDRYIDVHFYQLLI